MALGYKKQKLRTPYEQFVQEIINLDGNTLVMELKAK